jgi:AraC-like DNA-binding protein
MSRRPPSDTQFLPLELPRPVTGLRYQGASPVPLGKRSAWQSHGGATRTHPDRSLPFSFEVEVPGSLVRLHLVGIFALHADATAEPDGTLGATLLFLSGDAVTHRQEFIKGRHYQASDVPRSGAFLAGDGASREPIGTLPHLGAEVPVEVVTIDVPSEIRFDRIRFTDLGTPASFVIFDAVAECLPSHGCPFHHKGGGVPLSEVNSALRVGDRVKFAKAVQQLRAGILNAEDPDEARGEALLFLGLVVSSRLESGGGRRLHRALLEAARDLETCRTADEIADAAERYVEHVSHEAFPTAPGPSAHLVDRALAFVERNYAKPLTDAIVADELGLSTSHFRFLFRSATGQPFHKYLVALRLEKARRLLVEQGLGVTEVARAVGFGGLAHFSRAFTQRFSACPTAVRRNAG